MGLSNKGPRLLDKAARRRLGHQVRDWTRTALDRHVRLAVTGLSQSGKTVLITSLIDHLLQAVESQALPFLNLCAEERLIGVKLLPPEEMAPFPYEQSLDSLLAEPPVWPASTETLSAVRLAIRYRPGRALQRMVSDSATLYLDIIDYPGEWLLDLPLLQQDFSQWSEGQWRLLNQPPRRTLAESWLAAVGELDPEADADPAAIAELSDQYRGLLMSFRRHKQRLSLIQPGRFILPGELEGSELLQFFPLPPGEGPMRPGSNRALLAERYQNYCRQVVGGFYRQHFRHFDRQLVLVDCLKTLNTGRACFQDMQQALETLLDSFDYGRSGLLRRLFRPRIDRVLFASTKADHVTANQHHNLERFLDLLVARARREIRFEGLETRSMALAAFRATEAAEARVDGQVLSCLKGRRKETGEPLALFPGEVPTELPEASDWTRERFRFLDFAPPQLKRLRGKPAAHIRLDQALQFLIGDKLL